MPQLLHKPAMSEAPAGNVSVKALLRVQELGFFAILEYAVTVHLQKLVLRPQTPIFGHWHMSDAEHVR